MEEGRKEDLHMGVSRMTLGCTPQANSVLSLSPKVVVFKGHENLYLSILQRLNKIHWDSCTRPSVLDKLYMPVCVQLFTEECTEFGH